MMLLQPRPLLPLAVSLVVLALPSQAGAADNPVANTQLPTIASDSIARFGTLCLRHSHSVALLAASPSGRLLAATCADDTLTVWKLSTGHMVHRWTLPQIDFLSFLSDDSMLLKTGSTVVVLDIPTSNCRPLLPVSMAKVNHLAITPDKKALVHSSGPTVSLFDFATGVTKVLCIAPSPVSALAFANDGHLLLLGTTEGSVLCWNMQTNHFPHIWQADHKPLGCVTLSSNGAHAASIEKDDLGLGRLFLWEVASGKKLRLGDSAEYGIRSVAFVRDQPIVLVSSWQAITAWRLSDATQCWKSAFSAASIEDTGIGSGIALAVESSVLLVDSSGRRRVFSKGHEAPVAALAFAPHDKVLFSGSGDGTIRGWDLDRKREVRVFDVGTPVSSLSVDGRGESLTWHDPLAKAVGALETEGGRRHEHASRDHDHRTPINRPMCVSTDATVMAYTVSGRPAKTVVVRRGSPSEPIVEIEEPHYPLEMVMSRNGELVAIAYMCSDMGAERGFVDVWNIRTRMRTRMEAAWTTKGPVVMPKMSFATDGTFLVVGGWDQCIRLWEVTSGRKLELPRGPKSVASIACSMDDRVLAVGGDDGYLTIIETATGGVRRGWQAHIAAVRSLAFGHGGSLLASGSDDTTVAVWNVRGADGGSNNGEVSADVVWAEQLWQELGEWDSRRATVAIEKLARAPKAAGELLKLRITPDEAPRAAELETLVDGLEAPTFSIRQRSEMKLRDIGRPAEVILRKRTGSASAEGRERIKGLLEDLDERWFRGGMNVDKLRKVRCIEILERLNNEEGKALLTLLASGTSDSNVTYEAHRALTRMKGDKSR